MSKFHIDRQHKSRTTKLWLIALILPLIMFLVGGFAVAFWYQANLQPLSTDDSEIIVNIKEGATAQEISQQLETQNIIRSAYAFDIYTKLNGVRDDLQAGSYKLRASYSVQIIVTKLVNGEVATDLVVVLPASRIDQVKTGFIKAGFERDEVNQAVRPENYRTHPVGVFIPTGATMEGFIYPDSYQRDSQTTVSDIIIAALNELDDALTPDLQQRFAERGLTVYQAITLASIVESEVSAASGDRPTVAQVYLKRLSEGIPLQADPTAQYGTLFATGTTDGWRNYDTPYNTYLYQGLPPGPISNVSKTSLEAVAYPASTDYLYFVADDNDDTTHFARTLAEHEENIAKYCQVKCISY